MAREYAVASLSGERPEILFCSAGFDSETVTEKVPLSGGKELWISGQDEQAAANVELRRLLQEAQDANVAKETFLSNMSHDIRTPMNAIIGMTALAKQHIDEKARVSDALGKIEVASSHLLSLINEVLDMSRINSGRMTIAREAFSISDLLHDTLTIVKPQAEQKHHTFRFHVGNIYYESLDGDALRLRQIFVNIINNSVKYTNEGGELDVTVEEEMREDKCVLIFRCRDNGVGMTPEFLKRIFEPFERVSSTTNSKIEGTGLGMSIVKKLIEAMDGTIDIESEPGKGTLVTVSIPMDYEQVNVDISALEGKRLLILEADETLRETYSRYLGEFEINFTLADSSAGAMEALTDAEFRNTHFDAAIIGAAIRDSGSTLDIASYLNKSYPSLTLVLVSEDDWNEIEYRATRAGIEAFIPVPFFRKSLINGLNGVLETSEAQEGGPSAPDLTGKHILLAEDNLINREIACELLGQTNADVDTAEDGGQAVAAFAASQEGWYDLILMDVQMPVMDGYAATRQIRSLDRSDAKTVKIFAMTANTFAEDIAKAREAGMDSHLAKPIDINILMQVLRQFR